MRHAPLGSPHTASSVHPSSKTVRISFMYFCTLIPPKVPSLLESGSLLPFDSTRIEGPQDQPLHGVLGV